MPCEVYTYSQTASVVTLSIYLFYSDSLLDIGTQGSGNYTQKIMSPMLTKLKPEEHSLCTFALFII